jgi:hypothetical protein
LNAQAFEINHDMLDYLITEWGKDNSLIFGVYNKPWQNDKDVAQSGRSTSMIDIQRHNSLY